MDSILNGFIEFGRSLLLFEKSRATLLGALRLWLMDIFEAAAFIGGREDFKCWKSSSNVLVVVGCVSRADIF